MKKQYVYRGFFYTVGMLVLALGISLNTKTALGVSAIISVSYSISAITGINFGNMTLVLYSVFVLAEMLIHWCLQQKKTILLDILQLPLSLVFTRFLNVFDVILPDFKEDLAGSFAGTMPGRVLFLLLAIFCTGVGAAMSLNMRLIPNPGDGIVQALSDLFGKGVGITKNVFDLCNIGFTLCVGFLFAGKPIGIGLGTVLSMIGVGRVIAFFNHLFRKRMLELAGVEK